MMYMAQQYAQDNRTASLYHVKVNGIVMNETRWVERSAMMISYHPVLLIRI